MHLEHNERKYHVQFAKDFDVPNASRLSTHNRQGIVTERLPTKNLESYFSKENSIVHDRSSAAVTSSIHRESKAFFWPIVAHISFSSASTFVYICFERISSKCHTQNGTTSKSIIEQLFRPTTTKTNASKWFSLESISGPIDKTSMIMDDSLLIMCTTLEIILDY